jgi:hypothetical protein
MDEIRLPKQSPRLGERVDLGQDADFARSINPQWRFCSSPDSQKTPPLGTGISIP